MRKYTILIILGLIAALSACERDTVIFPDEGRDQMRVVGSASVTAAPDIATSQIGVQTFNTEVEPAVAENNRNYQELSDALLREAEWYPRLWIEWVGEVLKQAKLPCS